jgi:hypothetical protein
MGYKRKRKIYRLDFAGTEYEGLEVRVRGLTTGEFLELVMLGAIDKESFKETEAMLKMLASHLVSWNLEDDDGELVPATYEGVKSNDLALNLLIVSAWTDAIGDVPAPLPNSSPSGEQFPVVSIPMETLSGNPPV